MNQKDLFIAVMQNLVNLETVFDASAEYWGATYDNLKAGALGVDPHFETAFRTINIVEQINSSPMLLRREEDSRNYRMLLDALHHRLGGFNVFIFSISRAESDFVKSEFFRITEAIFADQSLSPEQEKHISNGQINFIVANPDNLRDVCLQHDGVGLLGCGDNHKLFLTQETIQHHFIKKSDPFVSLLAQYASDKPLSDFIVKSEAVLQARAKKRTREQQEILSLLNVKTPSEDWILEGCENP